MEALTYLETLDAESLRRELSCIITDIRCQQEDDMNSPNARLWDYPYHIWGPWHIIGETLVRDNAYRLHWNIQHASPEAIARVIVKNQI